MFDVRLLKCHLPAREIPKVYLTGSLARAKLQAKPGLLTPYCLLDTGYWMLVTDH
jgi:hypothetical protein